MPIPKIKDGEQEQDYVSRCISELYDEYGQEQASAICYSTWRENMSVEDKILEEAQQGGVVSGIFGRTKFQYPPNAKESMSDFMNRCMSDEVVRDKKKDRGNRAGFCYSQYQSKYILSLAKRWK